MSLFSHLQKAGFLMMQLISVEQIDINKESVWLFSIKPHVVGACQN